jgi:hypothetical protein
LSSRQLSKNAKNSNIQNYNFACGSIWVWNLVSDNKRITSFFFRNRLFWFIFVHVLLFYYSWSLFSHLSVFTPFPFTLLSPVLAPNWFYCCCHDAKQTIIIIITIVSFIIITHHMHHTQAVDGPRRPCVTGPSKLQLGTTRGRGGKLKRCDDGRGGLIFKRKGRMR